MWGRTFQVRKQYERRQRGIKMHGVGRAQRGFQGPAKKKKKKVWDKIIKGVYTMLRIWGFCSLIVGKPLTNFKQKFKTVGFVIFSKECFGGCMESGWRGEAVAGELGCWYHPS